MKKQSNVAYILRISLTLLLITGVVAALLAGVNMITKDRIAAVTKEKTDKAIAEVLPDAKYIEDVTYAFKSSHSIEVPEIVKKIYRGSDKPGSCVIEPGQVSGCVGYAIEVVPSGFDGEITMMVGIGADGKVLGISIISHTETAGLGAVAAANNAKGEAFRNQFIGMSGELAVSKDGGTVDAITGATITSRAVTEGVNAALACVEKLV